MGSKINRQSNPAKARSSTSKHNSKKNIGVKQASKKKHQKWSKDRSERVRDDLDRDADLLYNAMENPSTTPSSIPQIDTVVSLAENMQGLGR